MDSVDIRHSVSDAIHNQIKSLEKSIENMKLSISESLDVPLSTVVGDWSRSYQKWDKWKDKDEIESRIKETEQKIERIKAKAKDRSQANPCCTSFQGRTAERLVASMSTRERLKHMISFRKDKGNICYNNGQSDQALYWYEKSLIYFEYCFPRGKEVKLLNKERLTCLLNASACFLRLKQYIKCIEYCTDALEVSEGKSIKALFRRAQAHRFCYNFDEAGKDLSVARQLVSSTFHKESLNKEQAILLDKIKKYDYQTKTFATRMMKKDEKGRRDERKVKGDSTKGELLAKQQEQNLKLKNVKDQQNKTFSNALGKYTRNATLYNDECSFISEVLLGKTHVGDKNAKNTLGASNDNAMMAFQKIHKVNLNIGNG